MLPNSGITTTLVGNTLGVSTHDVGLLHRNSKVNKWSFMKPLAVNKPVLTDTERRTNSGFVSTTVNTSWNTQVQVFNYVVPTNNHRLGDFRGYNHNALGPKANPERLSWTDTPAGTDVRLGETDRTAVFNMEITFPEIPTWLFRSAEGQGNVQISYGMPGTPDFKEIVVQPIQIESLCNGNVDTYLEKYANKKIKFQAVQTLNLPARGYSETYYYYLTISNGFMESIEAYKIPVTIHRIKVPDPNNPDDYDYRIPVEYLNPANNTNVTYLRIGVFRKDTYEYFRFENIRNLMTGFELVLNYKTAKKPFANRIARLTLENEWKNASGIMMYTVPSNNEGKWTVVFRRSIIEGDTATGIIINGERSIG